MSSRRQRERPNSLGATKVACVVARRLIVKDWFFDITFIMSLPRSTIVGISWQTARKFCSESFISAVSFEKTGAVSLLLKWKSVTMLANSFARNSHHGEEGAVTGPCAPAMAGKSEGCSLFEEVLAEG
jgi:hypothetical protein